MQSYPGRLLAVALLVLPAFNIALAAPPDAGQVLRETRPPAPPPPQRGEEAPVVPEQPAAAAPAAEGTVDVRVTVSRFRFTGNLAFSEDVLEAQVADAENKALNFGELMQVVERVEAYYKAAGFFLAQAYLPPQKIRDGEIEISISEGRIGNVRLEGESRIKPDVVYGYLDRLPRDKAVQLSEIERQVLLVNDLFGSRATLDLQTSDDAGKTDIVVAQKLDPLFTGRAEVNNYGMDSTGEIRASLNLNVNSPLHLGDRLSAAIERSENGNLRNYNISYDLPLGSSGWRLSAGASRAEYSLGGDFEALKASGTVDSLRAGVSYAMLRSRNANLGLRLDYAHNDLEDRYDAAGIKLTKYSDVITAGINYDWLDEWMGGGSSRAGLSINTGRLELGREARAADAPPGPDTEGSYTKALLTLQREQVLHQNVTLLGSLVMQVADKNLDSSEKFSIGGPGTMPGYASGEASGDEGALLKLKLNWHALESLSLGLFADYAAIRLQRDPVVGAGDNRRQFTDAGLSLDWQGRQGLTASLMMAWAGHEKPNPADNDRPRYWANFGYNW